jgi:hypothetical protein|tara:strand:+ start:34527 stop:34877 length:351 start_codon:yes stop_codon:yes gene_type:complete
MEQEKTNNLEVGAYGNLNTADRNPSIKFEVNTPVVVQMDCEQPREINSANGVFYVFNVLLEGEQRDIATSAYTLLKGFKKMEPFVGKILKITKVMEGAKQLFKVEENAIAQKVTPS